MGQAALVTWFDFRQRVQTYTRRVRPPSLIRTFWRLGLKRRRVATIEWLREFPNAGPFPQLKQTLAMIREMVAGGRVRSALFSFTFSLSVFGAAPL